MIKVWLKYDERIITYDERMMNVWWTYNERMMNVWWKSYKIVIRYTSYDDYTFFPYDPLKYDGIIRSPIV